MKKGIKKDVKTHMLRIRIDPLGLSMLDELSRDSNVTMSEYIRGLIFDNYRKYQISKSENTDDFVL